MNLYIVAEGKTEKKIYSHWIPQIRPELKPVEKLQDIKNNNFYVLLGGGYPQMLDMITIAYKDINNYSPPIKYLLICVDSEEITVEQRIKEINEYIEKEKLITNAYVHIIVQNHCIENWLMGNRKINIQNATSPKLIKYVNHYNVNKLDPEEITSPDARTIAQFSYDYLREMFREKKMIYSKERTKVKSVILPKYLNQLIKRYEDTNHIITFGNFYNLLRKLT